MKENRTPHPRTSRPGRLAASLAILTTLAGGVMAQPTAPQSQTQSTQPVRAADEATPQQQRRGGGGGRGNNMRYVYKYSISPHWFENDSRFWYRNDLRGGAKEFILVDADKGVRAPAFDHSKLAAALSKSAGKEYTPDHLPFSDIEFTDNDKVVQFKVDDNTWKCDLTSYECSAVKSGGGAAALEIRQDNSGELAAADADDAPGSGEKSVWDEDVTASPAPQQQDQQQQAQAQGARRQGRGRGQGGGGGRGGSPFGQRESSSPDGNWTAFIKDNNVFLRSKDGGDEIQLSHDGDTNNAYGRLAWAPDSKDFVAWRIEPENVGDIYHIQSSPPGGGRAVLQTSRYSQAGDTFTRYELSVFSVSSHTQTKPEVDRTDFRSPSLRWDKDGYHFTYEKEDRGHQRFRIIEVDTHTAAVRNIVDEKTDTFIWTDNTDAFRNMQHVRYLDQTPEAIYESEQSGWRHLYLVDLRPGGASGLKPITRGDWLVRGIDRVDQEKREIWFEANGMNPKEDPYYTHFCRINFDGSGLVVMTEGNGDHSVTNSPDRKYLIDTFSQTTVPPVHNLRRVSDGKLVCKLEAADISELKENGWVPTETFVAKGRDGKTDIYGTIERPRDFDPNKKYPLLEDIYAGPQGTTGTTVPTTFIAAGRHSQYTTNGIIVVKIDGMGTPNRSKSFHDVCWHNLADAGFADRIAWMKAAAEKYPYMDITRVGIYGTSAGGQNAAGAVLFHPEFYKVAVANCGCHDNRIDKSSWNEQWMGYMPPDKIWNKDPENWYSQCSNIDNADKLKGKLFLIVGELDSNVPPESTLRFVDALIKARKDFDMLVVPGADHGAASPVTARRTQDFLVSNLLHVEIPNRNETPAAAN